MNCEHCQAHVSPIDSVCPKCGAAITPQGAIVDAEVTTNPYAAPQSEAASVHTVHAEGDATGGIIPYKNPKALLAYYLGIASGIPIIGFPIGIVAFVLGILGLRDRTLNPVIKGSVHAWIGIGCGGLFAILWGLLIVSLFIGVLLP